MRSASLEQQYRQFLFGAAGLAFIGTVVELWFVEHTESTIQLLPFVLCGVGFLTAGVTWYTPRKKTIRIHQSMMGLIAAGGFYGIYEHLSHNFAFELEIRPNATAGEVFWDALGGASPLMAPGILTFAAVLALAATYKHPALTDS